MAHFTFEAQVIYWRGPSPFFFVPIPLDMAADIRALARLVTYGWGMIPVDVVIGDVSFYTAMFA